uniref:Ammonium transporter n=1 Tax=Tetradesmus obliquus TaxID=3088 RepID=A0A383VXJ7_TETOB|eukprot:jgi/Sobl393_1/2307/SZX69589.1
MPGFLDNASPGVMKGLSAAVLAALFAIFIAMSVTAPTGPITGDGEDLSTINTGDTAWMLVSSAIVLMMCPGIAFFYGGMVQSKNVVSTIMQAFLPLAIIPVVWSIVGFGLAFGESVPGSAGILGNPADLGGLMYKVGAAPLASLAATIPLSLFFVFQMVFAVVTPAIIIGSVADRVNVSSLCIFIALWHIIVYCPIAHMVWHPSGIIRVFGVLDYAGGTVVHMSSGFAGVAAAKYLGHSLASAGRRAMAAGSSSSSSEGHVFWWDNPEPANVPIVVLGTTLLWVGWFGFNAGSALGAGAMASHVFMTTNAAAGTAMLGWLLMDQLRGHKIRATGACIGAVIGLVAITPAAGFVNYGSAALIGMIGAITCALVQEAMDRFGKKYLDDTLDVWACHGVGGTVGMICTALFTTTSVNPAGAQGAFYGNPLLLGKTLLVLVIVVPWFLVATWGCLWVTDKIMCIRVSDLEEMQGLDISKHGERAVSELVHIEAIAKEASMHGSKSEKADLQCV